MKGDRILVWCSDGQTRWATATAEPETADVIRGNVSIRGRTVTGLIMRRRHGERYPGVAGANSPALYRFEPSLRLRNSDELPQWPAAEIATRSTVGLELEAQLRESGVAYLDLWDGTEGYSPATRHTLRTRARGHAEAIGRRLNRVVHTSMHHDGPRGSMTYFLGEER